jgi:hypothetical protein
MALLNSACKAAVEGFTTKDAADPSKTRQVYSDFLAVLLALIISLVILAFVGKLLWNTVIVDLFTIARPVRSFWQILGLMIFVSLINP